MRRIHSADLYVGSGCPSSCRGNMKLLRRVATITILLLWLLALASFASAQAVGEMVAPLLEKPVQPTALTAYQLQTYLAKYRSKPVAPATAQQWTAEAQKLRKHILEDVAFHGWPE